MAKLNYYGFIFIGPGYDSKGEVQEMDSGLFKAKIAAVSTIESGCNIAKYMVSEGVQVIELCGGFEKDGLQRIISSIEGEVPVGSVDFGDKDMEKLKAFLDK